MPRPPHSMWTHVYTKRNHDSVSVWEVRGPVKLTAPLSILESVSWWRNMASCQCSLKDESGLLLCCSEALLALPSSDTGLEQYSGPWGLGLLHLLWFQETKAGRAYPPTFLSKPGFALNTDVFSPRAQREGVAFSSSQQNLGAPFWWDQLRSCDPGWPVTVTESFHALIGYSICSLPVSGSFGVLKWVRLYLGTSDIHNPAWGPWEMGHFLPMWLFLNGQGRGEKKEIFRWFVFPGYLREGLRTNCLMDEMKQTQLQ